MATSGAIRRLPVVVILGLTGAGKSKLALQLAVKFKGEIISTDSMQIYKGLDIATNKVSAEERELCTHHMIDIISPQTVNYTVTQFRNRALPLIDDILSRQKIPFIVGGTNYYIESLLWNFLLDNEQVSQSPCSESSQAESDMKVTNHSQTRDEHNSEISCKRLKPNPDSDKTGIQLKTKVIPSGTDFKRDHLENINTSELYEMLRDVDRERADRLHPNDRRKILRSLEVFYRDGKKMSELLKEQHRETGLCAVSGPLRFSDVCVIWLQCKQEELDARNEKRVEEMIEQGLISELTQFHREYNEARLKENKIPDYSQGIFQSIGFKEFHDYLMLSEDDRQTDHGKELLRKGIEDMKIATRQYARKQKRWILGRFLKRRGGNVPPVYAVDGSEKNKWEENVLLPACEILKHYLKGKEPPHQPLPVEEIDHEPVYKKCNLCNVVTLTVRAWEIHINGKRHKRNAARHRREESLKTKTDIDEEMPK